MTQPPMSKPKSVDLETLRRQEEAGTHVMAARNAKRKGERERAFELLREAFKANPGDEAAITLLGEMYLEDGETEKALKLYERALQAHPGHSHFEEQRAICALDLEEMEADRVAKQQGFSLEEASALEVKQPVKALSLSVLVPGAGQFYNDESQKGLIFFGLAVVGVLGTFVPILRVPSGQFMDEGPLAGLRALGGTWTLVFWLGLGLWSAIWLISVVDAGLSASRHAHDLRRARGLET